MKSPMKISALLIVSLFWAATSGIAQQGSIDTNRMNRDINIMENILSEMFKTRWENNSAKTVSVPSGTTFFSSSRGINSTYLPDYGIIFMIPGSSSAFVFSGGGDQSEAHYSFVYGSEGTESKVTEESVVARIKEFLRDYGSTIGQLQPDDHIMVIYGSRQQGGFNAVRLWTNSGSSTKKEPLPTLSVVAKKGDLDAYRAGRIDASELNNRLSVAKEKDTESRQLDMEVMANIFETAFKNSDEKSFKIRGSVNHLNLDNFGALFFFDARYSEYSNALISFSNNSEALRKATEVRLREVQKKTEKEDDLSEAKKKQAQLDAYNAFKTQLKEYLVDYGRTLKSVQSDQFILVSVSLSSSLDEIPERIDLQLKKSVLEQVDRGSVSRSQALSQVSVREY